MAYRSAPKRLTVSAPSLTVGLLVDLLDDSPYQWAILRGAIDSAYDLGAHLLCFVGGVLGDAKDATGERNGVFDLARAPNVDALVLLSGSIGKGIGSKRLQEFADRYRPMPMCSIAVELDGISSICVENESGIRASIDHMARVHHATRIAFVCGPAANAEAERRLRAYRAALDDAGIAFVPELVVPGNFEPDAGRDAVRILFDDRKLPVQDVPVIVTANDSMALGVLDELAHRNIRVPDQVAVLGFDDVDEARVALPPLTTVRQPLYEQGRDAVRMVVERLRNATPPERAVRHTELVVRRSCGCLAHAPVVTRESEAPVGPRLAFQSSLIRRRQVILAEMSRASRGELGAAGPDWGERLLNAFAEQIGGARDDTFVRTYDGLLRRLSSNGADPSVCNEVVTALRARMLRCLAGDPDRRVRAEDLFHEARMMTAQVADRVQASQRMQGWQGARALGRAAAAIAGSGDIDELSRAVAEHLPGLGIPRCFLIEFCGERNGQRTARMALSHTPDARRPDAGQGDPQPAVELLRSHVLPSSGELAFAVLPIFDRGKEWGAVALELGAVHSYLYETLRDVFGSALGSQRRARREERGESVA